MAVHWLSMFSLCFDIIAGMFVNETSRAAHQRCIYATKDLNIYLIRSNNKKTFQKTKANL